MHGRVLRPGSQADAVSHQIHRINVIHPFIVDDTDQDHPLSLCICLRDFSSFARKLSQAP